LSHKDVISDDGITMRNQVIQFQHDDPSFSKLFDLAKTEHNEMSVSFYEVRNDVLVSSKRICRFDTQNALIGR